MSHVLNLIALSPIALFFLLSLSDAVKKNKLDYAPTFYEDGRMGPMGYLMIQRGLSKSYHSQP